jgi:hypothetical protein
MSLEQTIRHTVIAESQDLDGRLQQLVRAGLMPANTIPILRKAISKVQGGMTLQGAERDVMANFINSMMFIVLGDDAIFNRARAGAKTYATEAKEKTEYDYEGDMAMGQLKSIIANSQRMHDMLSDDTNLPEWVQSKITLAEDYISTASNYMQGEMNEETVNEYAALAGVAGRMIASKLAKNAGAGVATRVMSGAAGSIAAKSAVKKFSPTKETNEEKIEEKRGLWDNIHAKRKRIKGGSGERMRKPGSEGAPTAAALKASQTEEVDLDENRMNRMRDLAMDINSLSHEDFKKKHRKTKQEMQSSLKSEGFQQVDEDLGKHLAHAVKHLGIAQIGDVDHPEKHEKKFHDAVEKVKQSHGEQAAKDFHAHAHDDAHHLTGSGPGERGSQFHKHMSGNEKKSYDKHFNKLLGEGFDSLDELSKATLGSYVKKASGAEQPKNVMSPKNVPLTKIAAYQGDSETGHFGKRFNQHTYDKAERLRKNRETGIKTAVNKLTKEDVVQVDEISKKTMGRYINKAKDSIDMTSYRSGIKDGTAISSSTPYKSNNPLERKLTKRHKGISMAVKKLTKEDIDAAKSMNESYKTKFDAALEHYNIKSPSELGEEQRKEFFNHVDLEFKKGDK